LPGRKPSRLTSTNVGTAWRDKFFDDARGSAIECAACLDASVAKGFASLDPIQAGKEMLLRLVAMLTKLLMRFDPEQYRVHESAADLATPFEHDVSGKGGPFLGAA
jgi:hypothetical protein